MPEITKQLNQSQTEIPFEVRPSRNDSATIFADGLNSAVEGVAAVQDQNAKVDFLDEINKISEQEATFSREQKELEDQLITAKDKQLIDSIHGKLLSLERGERKGALTPLEAETRRRAILANAVTQNPWLATDFKAMASAVRGSGSSSRYAQPTPEQAALDDLRKRATSNGVTLSAQREMDMEDLRVARLKKSLEKAEANGSLSLDNARLLIATESKIAAQRVFQQAFSIVKQDPRGLDATDWITLNNQAKSAMNRRMLQIQAGLSDKGVIFDDVTRARFQSDLDREFALNEAFINSKDKLAFLERMRKIINEEGVITLSEQNPYVAAMIANGAKEQAVDLAMRIWPKFLAQVQRHGSFDSAKVMAENLGDPAAIQFINAVQFNKGMYAKGLYNKLRTGQPPIDNYDQILLNGMASSALQVDVDPTDEELAHVQDMAHKQLQSTENPEGELDHYLNPRIVKKTLRNKKAIDGLKNVVKFRTLSATRAAPTTLHTVVANTPVKTHDIVYDTTKRKFVVYDRRAGILEKSEAFKGRIPTSENSVTDSLNRMLKLNTMYNLFGDKSQQEWIDDILKEVNREIPKDDESTN